MSSSTSNHLAQIAPLLTDPSISLAAAASAESRDDFAKLQRFLSAGGVLTPKFCTRESLICGPNLVKNLVWRRKISSEDSAEELAVGSLLLFGKGTVCADFAGLRGDVARAEGTNGWISIRTWAIN
jgi:hypothetical protein